MAENFKCYFYSSFTSKWVGGGLTELCVVLWMADDSVIDNNAAARLLWLHSPPDKGTFVLRLNADVHTSWFWRDHISYMRWGKTWQNTFQKKKNRINDWCTSYSGADVKGLCTMASLIPKERSHSDVIRSSLLKICEEGRVASQMSGMKQMNKQEALLTSTVTVWLGS